MLYAFFRIADEVVDNPDPPPRDRQRSRLDRIREEALGRRETNEPVIEAFLELRERYGIPDREVEEFIGAMQQDITAERYGTYADLEDYLRGSSVAVAYMMLSVMEAEDPKKARPHAKALGQAFQLTNFLRDVREDIREYGRIYLPQSTLERHGVTEEELEGLEFTEEFAAAMRTELERTETLYRRGVDGIRLLPEDCQFGVMLAAVLYADHHRLIREQDYDVLSHRPTLSLRRRVQLLAKTWWHWRRTGDPRATFGAASALGSADQGDEQDPDPKQGASKYTYRWGRQVGSLMGAIRSRIPTRGSR